MLKSNSFTPTSYFKEGKVSSQYRSKKPHIQRSNLGIAVDIQSINLNDYEHRLSTHPQPQGAPGNYRIMHYYTLKTNPHQQLTITEYKRRTTSMKQAYLLILPPEPAHDDEANDAKHFAESFMAFLAVNNEQAGQGDQDA